MEHLTVPKKIQLQAKLDFLIEAFFGNFLYIVKLLSYKFFKISVPSSSGKAKNKLKTDPNASGDHTTLKRDHNTGEITNYETWKLNPKNPTGFDSEKRYDGMGSPHKNPFTGEDLMPHVHDKTVPGGVRSPIPWEVPRKP